MLLLLHLQSSFHLLTLPHTATKRLNMGLRHIHSVKSLIFVSVRTHTVLWCLWEQSVWEQELRCSQALGRAGAAPALHGQQSREGKEDKCWAFASSSPARGGREEVVRCSRASQGLSPAVGDRQLAGREITAGHGEPPLGSREERQGIIRNIRQAYRLTSSLHEATLWSLSIPDDKIWRWKPAFVPCLNLPAPAAYGGLKRLENRDRDSSRTKICHCWLTQSRQETRGLKTAHDKNAIRLAFKPCLQAFGLKNNTHRWPFMFSSLGAFFPAGMRGLGGLLRLCGDSTSALRSDHVLLS